MSEALFERYLRNDLDEAGARELSALLATEEGARAFSEFVQEWTLLGEAAQQRVAEAGRQSSRRIKKRAQAPKFQRAWIGWAAGAAAAILFMIALATPTRLPPPQPIAKFEPPPPPTPVEPVKPAIQPYPAPAPRPDPPPPPVPPPPPPPPPAPKVDPPAPPPDMPKPVDPPRPETPRITKPEETARPVIALLRRAAGEVFVLSPNGRRRAMPNEPLAPDEGLEVAGPHGQASLEFPDQTRIDVNPDSTLERLVEKQGKRTFALTRGSIVASVTKQAAGRSVAVSTPHAEVTVLGTQFLLVVTPDSSRVEVREGRVRMTRLSDPAGVEVGVHHSATVAKGQKLEAKPTLYTLDLQDGVAGYVGTRDTSLSGADPTRAFGGADVLEVDGDEVDGKKIYSLLKWDLATVPRGAVIRSAVVTLDIVNESQGKGYSFYEMKRAWSEGEITWSQASGLKGRDDRGVEPLGTVAPRVKGQLSILLTPAAESVIQKWLLKPDFNHGFVIANDSNSDGFKFHAREAYPHNLRPRLTLTYTLAK